MLVYKFKLLRSRERRVASGLYSATISVIFSHLDHAKGLETQ